MENAKQNKMGTAPIFPLIVSMSLPAMFSMLIQAMYNIVDSIFVAWAVSVNASKKVRLKKRPNTANTSQLQMPRNGPWLAALLAAS